MFEKLDVLSTAAFITSFCMRPIKSLEKSVCSSECDQKRNQDFAKRKQIEPKANFFVQKLSN